MAIASDLTKLTTLVDRLLRENRPDRYSPEAADWLDAVSDMIPLGMIPENEVRRFAIRSVVGRREGVATRKANRLLREVGQSGQLVLDWWEQANDPITVETRFTDEAGNARTVNERVALRAATAADMWGLSQQERERADSDHKARLMACDGADFIAESMYRMGASSFAEWAEAIMPRGKGGEQ